MTTITEDYVSLETAKLLKEKGFDEPIQHFYKCDSEKLYRGTVFTNTQIGDKFYNAPTLQMAMAWLRTKHIIIVVCPEYFNVDGICSYWGVDIWVGDNYEKLQGDYPSYEEAVESALKYCLENLI